MANRAIRAKRTRRPVRRAPSYLSARQAASLLHVSSATISRWARASWLPYVQTLGGHRRYPAAEMERLAEHLSRAGQPTNGALAQVGEEPRL